MRALSYGWWLGLAHKFIAYPKWFQGYRPKIECRTTAFLNPTSVTLTVGCGWQHALINQTQTVRFVTLPLQLIYRIKSNIYLSLVPLFEHQHHH
jgi:hypothetical protein